jgi:hypothetical protein
MSKFELLAAVQACMIYLIMAIIDQSSGNEQNSPELLFTLSVSYIIYSLDHLLTFKGCVYFFQANIWRMSE